MNIEEFVDLKMLQRIQNLFSDATGLAAIAVNAEGKYVTEGSNFTDFCMKYTRGNSEGMRRCVKCDTECKGTYFCHAGLMDFAADIVVDNMKVGSIIGGQVLPSTPDLDKFRAIARDLGIPEDEYIAALKKVPIRSEKMIRASAEMLGLVVNQLANMEYIKKLNAKKIEVFDEEMPKALEAVNKVKLCTRDLKQGASMENILSLNASVEAARAGKAGVGFAIVAREIGEISRNSSITYTEIEALISGIEKSIENIGNVKV